MPDVVLESISKSFPATRGTSHPALHDVQFAVPSNSFTAILGPSGCGKSTTLRIIAGLERADGGVVSIGGKEVTNVPSSERELAMVFQNYALFPHLSVAENIIFGLKVRRVPRAERDVRLSRVARQLQLEPYLSRRPAQLSGGQRQRVALGRALVSGAQLILMDEPLSNLDARLRAEMRIEIRELQQRLNLTVIYVTHDQVEAMTMADTVVVMREGRIDQISSPEDLYLHPASTHIARFIGSPPMNLLEVRREADSLVFKDGSRIDASYLFSRYDIAKVGASKFVIGVRPEDLTLGIGEFTLPAHHIREELLGADRLVTYQVGGENVQVRLPASERMTHASELGSLLQNVHIFDGHTGDRIATEARLSRTNTR